MEFFKEDLEQEIIATEQAIKNHKKAISVHEIVLKAFKDKLPKLLSRQKKAIGVHEIVLKAFKDKLPKLLSKPKKAIKEK